MSILRVAGTDIAGLVIDVIVVESERFDAWMFESMAMISTRWPGGVYVLDDDSPVDQGWSRVAEAWVPPVTTREHRIDETNQAMTRIFSSGFYFRGKQLSLSVVSQVSAQGIYITRNTYSGYPILWPNIDDTDFVELTNAEDVAELYETMTAHIITTRNTGAQTKKDIP